MRFFSVYTGRMQNDHPARLAARRELIPTRQSLLSRLKQWDDREGWNEFFNTYWKLIFNTARKAGLTDAESQDVVQETVISVLKHIPQFQYNPEGGSFKNWLLQMTHWRISDQFRLRLKLPQGAHAEDKTNDMDRIADPAGPDLESI